jgi:hypothetical protein
VVWLLAALAWAAPPEDVDLTDVGGWIEAGADILDGPAGCWEIVGKATWAWEWGRFGGRRGDAMFAARVEDGEWTEIATTSLGEERTDRKTGFARLLYDDEITLIPLVGRVKLDRRRRRGDEDRGPSNVLRDAMAELVGDAEVAYAEWDEPKDGVRLLRSMKLGKTNSEAAWSVWFPGGDAVPTALDVTFPKSFYRGTLPRIRISDAEVHVRAVASNGRAFPVSESVKYSASAFGFHMQGAQTIQYRRASPCDAPPVEVLPPAESSEAPPATAEAPVPE